MPELAAEALGDAEQHQEAQQRLAQLVRRRQKAGGSEAGDVGEGAVQEELEAALEAAAEAAEEAAASKKHSYCCQLCGGKHAGKRGLATCPVAQMALALHKPPPGGRANLLGFGGSHVPHLYAGGRPLKDFSHARPCPLRRVPRLRGPGAARLRAVPGRRRGGGAPLDAARALAGGGAAWHARPHGGGAGEKRLTRARRLLPAGATAGVAPGWRTPTGRS